VSGEAVFHRDLESVYPLVTHGKGSYLFTEGGGTYLDGSSGAVAANLGHGVEEIAEAMYTQAKKVGFAHTLRFETAALHEAASRIQALAPNGFDRVFFASGGSEANESALKLARQWHASRGDSDRHLAIGMWDNYHGNTLGALAVGGDSARRHHFAPMFARTLRLPSWTEIKPEAMLEALTSLIRREGANNISALILEPFVGSQLGAFEPSHEALRGIVEICHRNGIVVIADEVMSGFGRCGQHFAIERSGMTPDLITFGKGVTAGYAALSGVIVSRDIVHGIQETGGVFHHGFTYSGHPIAAAAASAALKFYVDNNVLANVSQQGGVLRAELDAIAATYPTLIAEVRGDGMLFALEFHAEALPAGGSNFVNQVTMSHGLVLYPGAVRNDHAHSDGPSIRPHVLVAPPLTITEIELSDLVRRLRLALDELVSNPV
jgi:adenosylmethionine-8-amino-7-oxononanoate aminotransferase